MSSPDAHTITDNLTEAMRFFGRARSDAEVHELPGVSIIFCGLDYAAFNAAVMSAPDGHEVDRLINGPAQHFKDRKLRWSYWFCDDLLSKPDLRRATSLLQSHGLMELTAAPGMVADSLAPPSRALPRVEVRPVNDVNTRSAFVHITSIAFDVPWMVCREVYGADRAWTGSFRGYVGYTNGLAVATTAVVVAAGVAGIYSVATLPGHRGRGYAEAVMRDVLGRVRRETGVERTVLQSTRSGYQLYTKMGYRTVTGFTVFITE